MARLARFVLPGTPHHVTQRFNYDGNAMIGEYNNAGTMLRRYVHGSNSDWAGTIAMALARPMAPPSPYFISAFAARTLALP